MTLTFVLKFFCAIMYMVIKMKKEQNKWIITVFILTFILSITFSLISNVIVANFNNIVLSIILILTISLGILFDIIGTASISSNESTFHALNSKKKNGAKEALFLIKNNNKISSICNDIIGDICGIISGSLGTMLSISISSMTSMNNIVVSIILASLISALTVGGKAIFKIIAINNADSIIFAVGKIINKFSFKK